MTTTGEIALAETGMRHMTSSGLSSHVGRGTEHFRPVTSRSGVAPPRRTRYQTYVRRSERSVREYNTIRNELRDSNPEMCAEEVHCLAERELETRRNAR